MPNCKRAGVWFVVTAVLGILLCVPVQAQVGDQVVVVVYLDVNPQHTGAWLVLFKKHFVPALEELKDQGDLLGYHLFVPGIHHPGSAYTHALVIGYQDRAAQDRGEKKLRDVFNQMPASEAKQFQAAVNFEKHFDDEWREINFDAIELPEEKQPEQEQE